jgi:ThiF family
MSETLISRNPDLAKLEAAGLRLRIIEGAATHLIVDGVPAVNSRRELVFGSLYSPLEIDQNRKTRSPVPSHQCWWIGSEAPCHPSGAIMTEFLSNPNPENKGDDITTVVGYSMKLKENGAIVLYPDYYQKIRAYVALIWGAAQELDPSCTPYSDRPVPAVVERQKQVFRYPDMATTRAGIGAATTKLLVEKVAIVGLGGTGSYILDLIAKVPVGEIHLFDRDIFELHNAYRAPGAPQAEDLDKFRKVEWFASTYSRMHTAVIPHPYHITEANLAELEGFDFVFVAVDKPKVRKVMLQGLMARKIPFIDVGMGLDLDKDSSVTGIVRYTVGLPDFNSHVEQVVSFDDGPENDLYRNIQVADMNMLNAALAVIKWKKLRGFYADSKREHHGQYSIAAGSLVKEDCR